jgi:hypothetical protein
MTIEFDTDRWVNLRKNYDAWWDGSLERPLIDLILPNKEPDRDMPRTPLLTQATCANIDIPVKDLVDRLDWELSCMTFMADSYPMINLDVFGPGLAASFAGAILDNSTGGVWFHPPWPDRPIDEIHIEYDPNNIWLTRVKEFCRAAMDRWQGQVLVSMPDLGGNLDIIQSFL